MQNGCYIYEFKKKENNSHLLKLILNLSDEKNLMRKDKYVVLSNLRIQGKKIKNSNKNNK